MNPRRIAQRGVTIIELMIVVAIGAILAAIAVPSLRDTLYNMRQSTALGLLVNDLNQARGEAIKRNSRVLVCVRKVVDPVPADPSVDLLDRCMRPDDVPGDWTDWRKYGWVVCMSDATSTQCVAPIGAPNPVIVRPPLDTSLTLTALDSAATPTGVIRFSPNSSAGAGTLALGGTWSGAVTRTVTIAVTGNISK